MRQEKLFESTEKPLECLDYFISGDPSVPDPQEEIIYTKWQILYAASLAMEGVELDITDLPS